MKNDAIIGRDIDTNEEIKLKEKDRLFNTLVLGPTGSGKGSISLKPMILRDILEGDCQVIVFEPVGDLADNIVDIAKKKNKEVVCLSPYKCGVSVNPLIGNEYTVIRELVNVFNTIYADSTPYFKDKCIQLLINSISVAKRVFGDKATFTELDMIIENTENNGKDILLKLIENNFTTENLKLASWFAEYYENNVKSNDFIEAKRFIKFYTEDKYISNVMNNIKNKNSININTLMEKEEHIIVGGHLGILRKDKGLSYSLLLLEKIITYLYNRKDKSKPVYLYINEFSTYINEQLVNFLLTNRCLNVGVIIGLQARCQINKEYQNTVLSNVRNLIIHPGLNSNDANYYSEVLNSMINVKLYTPENIIYKPFNHYVACIIEDGTYKPSITLKGIFFEED